MFGAVASVSAKAGKIARQSCAIGKASVRQAEWAVAGNRRESRTSAIGVIHRPRFFLLLLSAVL